MPHCKTLRLCSNICCGRSLTPAAPETLFYIASVTDTNIPRYTPVMENEKTHLYMTLTFYEVLPLVYYKEMLAS